MTNGGHARGLSFNMDDALAHLCASDAKLANLIQKVGAFGLTLDKSPSPFESLLEAILYQQL
ncbi:MAG TPA: hypothetical protein VG844_11625, partial [Terracidiphilus sp.]|nr:hypothetical protein [Terracidiphilus sp.]